MKHNKKAWAGLILSVFAYLLVHFCPLFLGLYIVWGSSAPVELDIPFPEGTEIVEQRDTHKGLFRTEGTAVTIAIIPQEHRDEFSEKLQECGFSLGQPSDEANALLRAAEHPGVDDARFSSWVLWTYQRAQVNTSSEPIPDSFTAIYDPDTGVCCCVEYDGAWLWL